MLNHSSLRRQEQGKLHRVGVNLNQLTRLANTAGDMPALAELRAGACSKPRCATPLSMIPARFLAEAGFHYGCSVRPAIAQTRRHRYSHSCVEPSL